MPSEWTNMAIPKATLGRFLAVGIEGQSSPNNGMNGQDEKAPFFLPWNQVDLIFRKSGQPFFGPLYFELGPDFKNKTPDLILKLSTNLNLAQKV